MLQQQLLSHSFVTEIEKGTLPLKRLQLFVLQDAWLVLHATQIDALTIAKTTDKKLQQLLVQNFSSYKREGKDSLLLLGEGVGLSEKDFQNIMPLAGCMALTHFFYATLTYGTAIEAIFAIIASKEIFTKMCQRIGKGLQKNYHLSDEALTFFTAHDSVEGKIAPIKKYIEREYSLAKDKKSIAQAVSLSNQTELLFFDAIMHAPLS